jgi:hypothetical protein
MARAPITRNQLADFLKDPESIRAFENLFKAVSDLTNTDIVAINTALQENSVLAGIVNAKIEQKFGNVSAVDSVEFNVNPQVAAKLGQSRWNKTDQTLDINMDFGVSQPVGQATYARVNNNTGSTITKGTAVGFSGVATNALQVAPFLANGTQQNINIVGIMAHDLPSGATNGYVTTWGFVRNVNTSAFTAGQILYVSTTVSGGLTATKPNAPNNIIPIAVCVVSNATTGVLFVRPTIDSNKSYGIFNKTTDQSPAAINTEYLLTFDNAEINSGVSIGSPTSRIVVANTASYEIESTIQISSSSASAKNVWVWFKKNGTAIADSARVVTIDTNSGYLQSSIHKHVQLAANDYIEIAFAADSTAITIDNIAATAFAPASPAAIVSITEI